MCNLPVKIDFNMITFYLMLKTNNKFEPDLLIGMTLYYKCNNESLYTPVNSIYCTPLITISYEGLQGRLI